VADLTDPFRFASILKLRLHDRDQVQLEIAELTMQCDEIQSQRSAIQDQRVALHNQPKLMQAGLVCVKTLQSIDRRDAELNSADQLLMERHTALCKQIECRRGDLMLAQQEVQQMEKLRAADEFQRQTHRNLVIQRQFDEQASQAFQRRRA